MIIKAKSIDELRQRWPKLTSKIQSYSDSIGFEVLVRRPSKSRDQEKKYHAMIKDIARMGRIEYQGQSVDFNLFGYDPFDVAKVVLICWFEEDLKSAGKKLKNPSGWIIVPGVNMPVMVRAKSSIFTKEESGWFINHLYSVGAENRVAWSDPEIKSYESLMGE